MANKIKFGLKNVYYAVATIDDTTNTATYTTPVALPGAVSLSLEPQGETSPFYADNIVYWVGAGNNGYSGDLELARIPESYKKDVLGYIEDTNGVLIEDANAEAVHFALLFQFEGDENATRHVMYNCTGSRASAAGETKGESIEPQTETTTITATSIHNAGLDMDIVKADLTKDVYAEGYNAWFTTVYQPASGGVTT